MKTIIEAPGLDIQVTTLDNGRPMVGLKGVLDDYTSPYLRDCLAGLISKGNTEIVLEATRLEFICAAGLGTLISALVNIIDNTPSEVGKISLINPCPQVKKVFSMTQHDTIFPAYPTREAYLSANPV